MLFHEAPFRLKSMNSNFALSERRLKPTVKNRLRYSLLTNWLLIPSIAHAQYGNVSLKYIKKVRKRPGYGEVVFPFCKCDARKDGFVVAAVGFKSLKLHACNEHGVLEVRVSVRGTCEC